MPSAGLWLYFKKDLPIKIVVNRREAQQNLRGTPPAKTALLSLTHSCNLDWLLRMTNNKGEICLYLVQTYGVHAQTWLYRWRLYLMASSEMFRQVECSAWGVCHYLFEDSPEK